MEQIAEQITQDFLRKLPEQTESYSPDELLSVGIPYIVVQTLCNHASSTIHEELKMPEIQWIDSKDKAIQNAWDNFLQVCQKRLVFPVSSLPDSLSTAVEECLKLALKPRSSVPEILFKNKNTLDFESLQKQVDAILVNKHFGVALIRYMQKKEKEEISAELAGELVQKIDEKLIKDYHPLNWAQALKPVFDLAGPSVNTELFQIFFDDKGKRVYASKFGEMEQALDESELIEVLSSADFLEVDDEPVLGMTHRREENPIDQEAEVADQTEQSQDVNENAPWEEEDKTEPDVAKVTVKDQSEADVADQHEDELPVEEKSDPDDEIEIEQEILEEEERVRLKDDKKEDISDESDPAIGISDVDEDEDDEEAEDEDEEETDGDDSWMDKEIEEIDIDKDEEEKQGREENIVDLFSQVGEKEDLEDVQEEKILTLVDDADSSDFSKEDADSNITLLSKFMFDDGEEESDLDSEEMESPEEFHSELNDVEDKEPTSIYEEMNLVKDDFTDDENDEKRFKDSSDEIENDEGFELSYKIDEKEEDDITEEIDSEEEDNETKESNEDDEDQPMWRSFLERDDLETESGYEYDEDTEKVSNMEVEEDEEDGFIEEPIYDLTTDGEDSEEKFEKISSWLEDEKDRFIEEIFTGSEIAYEQSLIEIVEYDNWKSASMYLEKEVFSRNKIDVYDEAAVDFTDRLHSFFIENKSK